MQLSSSTKKGTETLRKIPYISGMERFSCNIKKFQETETLQKFLIFPEMEPFSLPPENFLYFRDQKPKKRLTFSKNKSFIIFWKM